jgi:hypothetical protein
VREIIPDATPPQDALSFGIGTGPANFPDGRRATGDELLGHKLRKCRLEGGHAYDGERLFDYSRNL